MSNIPLSALPIGIIIIALGLTPWISALFSSTNDKSNQPIIIKGALTTLTIVVAVFALLFVLLELIGFYGIYLMMLDVIFGSWLGYAITQNTIHNNSFESFISGENKLQDD
ncbi:MAG: hypothetical protein AB8E82_18980 [Aureispira sp.]